MNDLDWFVRIADWEYDYLDDVTGRLDPCVWQAIAAKLLGLEGEAAGNEDLL